MRSFLLTLVFIAFFLGGFSAPFIAGLGYLWVDILLPQQLAYSIIKGLPLSFIIGATMFFLYFALDRKDMPKFGFLTMLLVLFAVLITFTTLGAVFEEAAWKKWDWAFKGLIFGLFFPYLFRSRVQIESALLVVNFSVGFHFIGGAAKTILGGGGYGNFTAGNGGLLESSTLATVCVMLIPINLYMARHSVIFESFKFRGLLFLGCAGCCLLTTIGTFARTGLVALVALAGLYFIFGTKRRIRFIIICLVGLFTVFQFAPESWYERMNTINSYETESSASTRLDVWAWTLNYVASNPLGGGFRVNNGMVHESADGDVIRGKGFHSNYFEVLGSQGIPGLFLYLLIFATCMFKLRSMYRYSRIRPEMEWFHELAKAVFVAICIFLVGGLFVGIAFQPISYVFVGLVLSLENYLRRSLEEKERSQKMQPNTQRHQRPVFQR